LENKQRELGLKILRNELENTKKQEQEKEKQAKEQRKLEKEAQLRKEKRKKQLEIQNAMTEEIDKLNQLIENKKVEFETATKNKTNEMIEQLQKEMEVLKKQSSEKQRQLDAVHHKEVISQHRKSRKIREPLPDVKPIEPPVPRYVPEPPLSPVNTSKKNKEIAKAEALKQQREAELATLNENRNNTKNKNDEEANRLQSDLTKLERKRRATEEAQQRDIEKVKETKDKAAKKDAKKGSRIE